MSPDSFNEGYLKPVLPGDATRGTPHMKTGEVKRPYR